MKFLALAFAMSLIGNTAVLALPLNNQAASSASSAIGGIATPKPMKSGASGASKVASSSAVKATGASKTSGASTAATSSPPKAAGAASATGKPSSAAGAKASSASSSSPAAASASASSGGMAAMNGTSPSAPSVTGAFANDAMTVSASLNALGTETDPEKIRSLASTAFQAESDEDQRRNVLNTVAGSAAKQSNALIVQNTPAVLDGLQAIMNDPTPATSQANLLTIEQARNPNILPSITQLSNAAMAAAGLPQMAVVFPPTTGSSGTTAGA